MIRAKIQRNCVELFRIGDIGAGRVLALRKHREAIHRERREMHIDGRVQSFPLQSKPVVWF